MPDERWKTAMIELGAAQEAFMKGDAGPLQALFSHADDVTVMGGFGGVERGWAEVGPRLAWAASHFHGGTYSQTIVAATVGEEVACLVSLERWARMAADGEALPVLELRVTQTFRREGGRWRLVHRHADELVEKKEPQSSHTSEATGKPE
jgi:ketosteroid isomerase-like protein